MQSPFIEKNCGGDLADIQLISTFNKGLRFYCVLLTFIVNTHGLFLWKIKNGITITNAFQKILDESNYKLDKI